MTIRAIRLTGDALRAALALNQRNDEDARRVRSIVAEATAAVGAVQADNARALLPLRERIMGPHGVDARDPEQERRWMVAVMETGEAYLVDLRPADAEESSSPFAAASATGLLN